MSNTALLGAGQTCWQTPQPVQIFGSTEGFPPVNRMASGIGHRSEQAVQVVPWWARQL